MTDSQRENSRAPLPSLCGVDAEIIRYLASNRFAKQSDLIEAIDRVSASYNMPRAIRRLKNYGLIETLLGDANTHLGYRLTRKGLLYAKRKLLVPDELLKSRPAFRSQYDHDRIVNEARRILSESSVVGDFVTEVELRGRHGKSHPIAMTGQDREWKVPDAIFTLTTKSSRLRVALEVELSQKAKARYQKIMKALLLSRQFEIVFFLCKDERILNILRNEVRETREQNPAVKLSSRSNGIYFTTLDLLRSMKTDAPWSGEESRFTLREIETSLMKSSAV